MVCMHALRLARSSALFAQAELAERAEVLPHACLSSALLHLSIGFVYFLVKWWIIIILTSVTRWILDSNQIGCMNSEEK